ncbi:MAG: hypothetical protein WC623_07875 [Pedobacter sp.]|uniref:hypothetical protein n=1 Tax=Pedobacter sp. TaxID=1411316 RepID=UPI00356AE5E4
MKKLILFFIFSYGTLSYGQRLTYDDLIFGLTNSIGNIEDRMLTKQLPFTSAKALTSSNPHNINHTFSKNHHDLSYLAYTVCIFRGTNHNTSITTLKLDEFIKLRTQIKGLGYQLIETIQDEKVSTSSYKKGNFEVDFEVSNIDDYKMYTITLLDAAKTKEMYRKVNTMEMTIPDRDSSTLID